ncbi:MAG: hypothetical protein K2X48_04120 [Chitinophagaceae bacterium]|nr:hypothetical protein [Chitinophagaceae bacterium]
MPGSAPTGSRNFRVEYNSQTVNYPFIVSAAAGVNDMNASFIKMKVFPNPIQNEVSVFVNEVIKNPVIIINNLQGK